MNIKDLHLATTNIKTFKIINMDIKELL